MQDELEDNHEDYCSILHEEWCELLSTIEVKDNSKRFAAQIQRLVSSIAASVNPISDEPIRVTRKKKARTDVLTNRKMYGKKDS